MPPKKSAPSPASDESDSDFDDVPLRNKSVKKGVKPVEKPKPTKKNPDEQFEEAAAKFFDGKGAESDDEDDGSDLFALPRPPRPHFLTRPDYSNRLMILNVEVENFKSYFGKASIGPFHKSFTSIIGPNGSGKSNLIDSLLFVFGFRASKIRSAKVGNLVHKSRGREPRSCTVTIYFQRIIDQTNQTYTVVENSKFTISRTAFTNNSSSYAIDGRPASKQEVEARLRREDIDIEHNRFLILQGEVEQIAMMKPVKITKNDVGMVDYLEDIIGSNRLEPLVKLFQKRVNKLLCDQSQQRIAREHARTSKTSMENQVRSAIEFMNKENETKTFQMKLDQKRRQRYMDKAAPLAEALEAKQAERKEVAEKLDTNKVEYKEADELERKLTKEKNALEKVIDKATKELTDLESEETRRLETIKRYEADVKKTETEKEKETKKRATLEAAPEKAERKIEKCKEEVETLAQIEKTANDEATKNLPEFEKQAEKPKEKQKELQEVWARVNADFNKIRSEATVANDELEDMKKMANSGTKKLDDLKTRFANYEDKTEKEKAELDELKPELARMEEKVKKTTDELAPLRKEVRDKQHEYAKTRTAFEEMRQQNTANQSSDRAILELMKAKEEGKVPTFMGKLGDMAYIDKKYDIAISNNFPARLDWWIVGKEEDAAKVIEHLHEKRLGRHTIQPLDRIKYDDRLLKPSPGKYPVPRLYDLVECDDVLKPAFYDMLKETIVADSNKHAQQLHKMPQCRGVNIVSLSGDILQANGNMTGGGRPTHGKIVTDRSKKVKTVSSEDKEAEKHLGRKTEQLKKEAEEAKSRELKLDQEHMESRRLVAELGNKVKTLETSIQSDTSTIATLRKTIETQEREAAKVKVDKKDLEAKQKAVDEMLQERDKLGEEAAKAKGKQEKVQEKLDELFRELVQCHRDEATQAQQKRLKLEKEMAKEAANITNSARNIAKCEENIARFQKEIDKKQKLLEELAERAPDDEAVETKKAAVEEMTTKQKEMEKEFAEITKKRSGLSKAETDLEEELKTKNDECMAIKERMGAHQAKIQEIEKKLSQLKVNRIPLFHFLINSSRPEDFDMLFDDEELAVVDENLAPEEIEKQKKHMACVMSDAGYAIEFDMRRKVLETTESYENVDGDKQIPIELLSDEKVREITDRDVEELQFKLKQAEQALDVMKAKVDLSVIDAYVKKVKQFNEETVKMLAITDEYKRYNTELHKIKKQRLEEFHSAFEFIGKHLVAVYKMLTDGGDAKLEYIDKDDPFTQGISFMVRPAKKAWKQIQFLSGGEKTLSSLALIFALHMFRPTPFYVMDEIDAALDYRNVSIIAQYVLQKTENAQFIIISLRNNMFELANRLVGIYKVDGCTQNVAIDPLAVCAAAKVLALNLEEYTNNPTMPDEVTRVFQDTQRRQNKEITAKEKQYHNFPSSSEINKAEKIVSVEGRVRKQVDTTIAPSTSRAASKATNTTERPVSTRPESRIHQMRVPQPRLVPRPSSSAAPPTGRTPRKERNDEPDDTTPPTKRSNSVQSPRSQAKAAAEVTKNSRKRKEPETESDEDSD